MRPTGSWIVACGLAAVVLLGPAVSGGRPKGSLDGREPASAAGMAAAGPDFTIRGRALGLFPGAGGRLRVRVTNPGPSRIRVTLIRARVGAPNALCGPSTVVVRPFRGSLRVPPRSSRRLSLRIHMRAGAPDPCQGARYPIRFTGSAS